MTERNSAETLTKDRKNRVASVPAVLPHLVEPFDYPLAANPALSAIDLMNTRDSKRTMGVSLRRLAAIASGDTLGALNYPWHRLRFQDTRRLRRAIATLYEPPGANVKLWALRAVLKEAWRLEYLDTDTYRRAADVRSVPGESDLAGRRLRAEELRALARACAASPGPKGARDAAVIALMARTGIRCCEVVRADFEHLDLRTGEIQVRGKGRRRRVVEVLGGAMTAMEAWLVHRGRRQGPLFWPVNRYGQLRARRIGRRAITQLCAARAREAGIPHFTPHDLRRTVATVLLENGEDVLNVSRILGHARTDTTRRYDRRGDETRRSALEKLDGAFA